MSINSALTLVVCALAVRLLADLTSARLVPIFRIYLAALAIGLLMRGDYTPAWMGLAVLAVKLAATLEMMRALCKEHSDEIMCCVWMYCICAGALAACLVLDLRQQFNLTHPYMVYFRQMGQVYLAIMALAMSLFSWAYHKHTGFTAIHGWLITILWMDYAIIGILTPEKMSQWKRLDLIWSSVVIATLIAWIFTTIRVTVRREALLVVAHRLGLPVQLAQNTDRCPYSVSRTTSSRRLAGV